MPLHRLTPIHNPEGPYKMENRRHHLFALSAVFSLALGCSSGTENPPNSGPQGGSSQAGSGGAGAGAGTIGSTTAPATGGVTTVTGGSSVIGGTSVIGGSSVASSTTPGTGGAAKGGTTGDLGGTTAKGGTTGDLGGTTAKGGTTGAIGGTTAKGGTTGVIGGATGGTTGSGGKSGGGGTATAGASGSGGVVAIPDAGPVDPNKKITFWMVGDSTMQNCAGTGQCGWAAEFQQYCGPNVTVSNQARGGRSIQTWIWGDPNVSKTATDANGECQVIDNTTYSDNLTTMLDPTKGMQPGDWVYVAFGINDGTATCNRHVGKALFQSDLDFMAKTIRSKGANPIFGTSTSGQSCSGSTNVANRGFGPETKAAGAADNVPVIDLLTLSVALYNSLKLCPGGSTTFWFDGTHFKTDGATQVAGVVAKAIKDQGIGLAAYLK